MGPPALKIQLQYQGVNFPIPEVYFLPNPRYFPALEGRNPKLEFYWLDILCTEQYKSQSHHCQIYTLPELRRVFFFLLLFLKDLTVGWRYLFFMGDVIFSDYLRIETVDIVPCPLSRFGVFFPHNFCFRGSYLFGWKLFSLDKLSLTFPIFKRLLSTTNFTRETKLCREKWNFERKWDQIE